MLYIFLFLIIHWYLSLFCQSFFLHRYGAHKMFTLSKFWELFFFVLTYISQGSSFLSPKGYAILHRMHHAYSDTEKDPHSPHFYGNIFSMMWKTKKTYSDYVYDRIQPEERFGKNIPHAPKLERFADTWFSRLAWMSLYISFYVIFATSWWMYLFLPIHFLMGPIQGAIVNWCGHKYGYQNFSEGDRSKNTLLIDFLLLGELFQNNHHHAPARANFAAKWYELDPIYPVIKVLSFFRILRPVVG